MKLRLFCLLLLSACTRGVLPGNDSFEYTDNESFRASLPFARKDVQVSSDPDGKSHLFSETPDGLAVRFVVRDAQAAARVRELMKPFALAYALRLEAASDPD